MGNNNDGIGGNGAWWIIILFLFAFAGNWGNYGNGGMPAGISENYTLISDMGQIERKIDGVYAGICDSTFALNNAITNGFASAQNTMTQGFAGLNTGIVSQGYESRLATQQLGQQMAQCCCDIREGISNVNFNMAQNANATQNAINTGFCQTNFNNQSNTRDIIDAQNAGTQAILKAIEDNKVEALKDRIAEQNQMINSLQLTASQSAQNEYLISALRPQPVPAFPASKLYGYCGCNSCGCNC